MGHLYDLEQTLLYHNRSDLTSQQQALSDTQGLQTGNDQTYISQQYDQSNQGLRTKRAALKKDIAQLEMSVLSQQKSCVLAWGKVVKGIPPSSDINRSKLSTQILLTSMRMRMKTAKEANQYLIAEYESQCKWDMPAIEPSRGKY